MTRKNQPKVKVFKKLFISYKLLNIDFVCNFGKFSSQIYPMKMKKYKKSEVIFMDQEFSLDFENLFSFGLTLQEHNETDPFLKQAPCQ